MHALSSLIDREPHDEELLAALLRAEAATQGPSKALTTYETYRRALRDDLGTDPGAALKAVHQELLQNEAPVQRHGVLHEPNPLLGREEDVATVVELLRTARVVSVVGPGGLGKTRLAHAVARKSGHRVVHFVELAGVLLDDGVAPEVASAVGAGSAGGSPLAPVPTDDAGRIAAVLGHGSVLLILDNCEQVTQGAANLVRDLVARTKDLRVLTTTRTPLGLSSESVHQLPELSPAVTVKLFEQRARAARPDAALPRETVEELCRHLDGLPLAVELAAARIRVLSVADIARRLQDRFSLLRGGSRDAPERHRTLQAVVDWSWNLLAPGDRAALRALSVFPGGFTADAAERLCGSDTDLLDTLQHLVDHSLLKLIETPGGTRFRMLETVREFSAARLDDAGETETAVTGFLSWARDFGVAHHATVFGDDIRAALDVIQPEQDNLLLAMSRAVARADGDTVAATAAVLGSLWTVESSLGHIAATVEETGWFLSHYRPGPDFVEVARSAATYGAIYAFFGAPSTARRHLVVLKRLPPPDSRDTLSRAMAFLFHGLTRSTDLVGDLTELCDSPEPLLRAVANGVLGYLLSSQAQPEAALAAARRLAEALTGRPAWYQVVAHSRLAELYLELGMGPEALASMREVQLHSETIGTGTDMAGLRWGMVMGSLQVGDVAEAERWLELAMSGRQDDVRGTLIYGTGIRAEIRLARGDVDGGLALWREVVSLLGADHSRFYRLDPLPDPAASELVSVAVVAHARHGRLDAVAPIVAALPGYLAAVLSIAGTVSPSSPGGVPTCGTLLLALGSADARSESPDLRRSGARMIALAEQCRFLRGFQPTMRPATATEDAEKADGPAYSEAVSEYAGLSADALREAGRAALAARPA